MVQSANAPSTRRVARMAFDPQRGRVVLYGGISLITGNWLQDIWEWDGVDWRQIPTANAPPGDAESALLFDPISGRMIYVTLGGAETWAYDGVNWVFADAHFPSMVNNPFTGWATDYQRGEAIIMGLWSAQFSTWAWDGQRWSDVPIHQGGPPSTMLVTAGFDWSRQRVVLFGDSPSHPCWERVPSGWQPVSVQGSAPAPRKPQGVCYAADIQKLVMIGGGGYRDAWMLTTTYPAQWRALSGSCNHSAGVLEPRDRLWESPWAGGAYELLVRGTGGYSTAALGGMWAGFSDSRWGSTSLPFSVSPYGIGGCDLFLSPDGFLPLAFQSGSARWTVTLPRDPALYGVEFFNQAMLYAPGASSSGFGLSTAVGSTVGNR